MTLGAALAILSSLIMLVTWVLQAQASISAKRNITPRWFWNGRLLGLGLWIISTLLTIKAYGGDIWYLVLYPAVSFTTGVINLHVIRHSLVYEDMVKVIHGSLDEESDIMKDPKVLEAYHKLSSFLKD